MVLMEVKKSRPIVSTVRIFLMKNGGFTATAVLLTVVLFLYSGSVLQHSSSEKDKKSNVGTREMSETSKISVLETKESEYEYIHDDPGHVWHWTRERPACPKLSLKKDCAGNSYKELYHHFHSEGWVTFTSCSLKKNEETVLEPVTEYVRNLTRSRASTVNLKCVKDLAADPDTVEFMEYIHGGRRAFPFQTLNFKVGTQQGFHSDLTFFDTQPRTLMAAAWVALEDTNPNNGPLKFVPKSHRYGIWDFNDIGLPYKYDIGDSEESRSKADGPYYIELAKIIKKMGFKTKLADNIKRGQTFIWAAALVHGGAPVKNSSLTRMSQVSHYFFEGSSYYWNPMYSDIGKNKIRYDNLQIKACETQLRNLDSDLKPAFTCADAHTEAFMNFAKEEL
mmetsp:Transcript_6571/g.8677  ORF Transcript_6571/g.8677 Transcript_6571/m.8677 type:complete len:392 (+) Transcript_6571:28-1203(+)